MKTKECIIEDLGLLEVCSKNPGVFLYNIVKCANVWISLTDCDGIVKLWNQYAEKLSGLSAEEARGQDLYSLIYPTEEARDKARNDVESQLKESGRVQDYAAVVTSKTGRVYQLSFNVTPCNFQEETIGYLQVAIDITEVRKANEHIKSLNKLLEAFYAISQQIIQADNVDFLMRGACEALARAGDYVMVSVTLLDDRGHPVDTIAVEGMRKKTRDKKPLQGFERQAINAITRTHMPYVCQDIYGSSDFEPWFPETREYGISSFITLPLSAQDTIVGALTLFSCRADSIDTEQISLLQSVANDLAHAVQSIRMRYNLNALQEVSLSITDTGKLGTVFDQVLSACVSLTRAGSGFIFLSGEANRVVAESGERILYPGDSGVCTVEALIKDVLEEGEALIKNDCALSLTRERKTFGRKPLNSLMLIPMLVKDEALGVIGLGNSPGGFSKSYLGLCSPFAAQLAMAVKKTQLFTEVNIALEEAKENAFSFRTIFETAADLILIVDSLGNIKRCNNRIQSMLGYLGDEIEGESIDKLALPEDADGIHRLLDNTYRVGSKYNEEYRFVNSAQDVIHVEINSAVLQGKDGHNVLMLVRDITERKRTQEELKYLTLHDPMTGLYNRRYFEEELRRMDIRRHGPITIISCDVDGLKLVNDTLGHQKGDELIKAAALVIKRPFRSCDVVARIGGDEFSVILPFTNEEIGRKAEKRILDSLEDFNKENPEIPLSLSVGVATSTSETTLEKLFHESDNAMYRHKASRGFRSQSTMVKILMLALGEKDFVSGGHVERVRDLAIRFGEALALSPADLDQLGILAQVHDIGKIGVSGAVLSKQGELTEEERLAVEKHAELGYRIAVTTPELARVADALVQHHEWWNGQGYPHGLKGEQILLHARIFAIVDAYDAMISYRPYREPLSSEEAIQELSNGAGTQFDPHLVVAFENMLASLAGL